MPGKAHAPRATIVAGEALRFIAYCSRTWPKCGVAEIAARFDSLQHAAANPTRCIPIESVFRLWSEVTRAIDDCAVPIRFAATRRPEDSGVMGLAAMTAASGREALGHVARYQRLISNSGQWLIEENVGSGLARIVWERSGTRDLGHRLANETVLAELVVGARQVFGQFPLIRVAFQHPAPRNTEAHREFFAAPLEWSAPGDYLELPRSALDLTPLARNSELLDHFLREAEAQLSALPDSDLRARVAAEINVALRAGSLSAKHIAQRVGRSERALRRALADEGLSFRSLVDDIRKQRAQELIRSGQFNATDAAFVLGFSESSAFSRAFRRWFGASPSSLWRKTHPAQVAQ